MFIRPDFSNYLIHFTKGKAPVSEETNNLVGSIKGTTAEKRLLSILKSKTIYASHMPWVGCTAVCFTECVWSSLFEHAKNYSSFGIGFTKEFIFKQGGNPVFYVRPTLFKGHGVKRSRVLLHHLLQSMAERIWMVVVRIPLIIPMSGNGGYFKT